MTTALNELQIASTAQEKNKVFFDHEPLSALRQRSALCSSIADGGSQSTSQQHALRPWIYIAFRCSHCGPVRQAIAELPTQAVIACPACSRECAFLLLGPGMPGMQQGMRILPTPVLNDIKKSSFSSGSRRGAHAVAFAP